MCSPSAGTGSSRGSPSSHEPGGSRAGIGPAGVATSRQRWRARSCGCAQNVGHRIDLRVGDLRVVQPGDDFAAGQRRERGDDDRAQFLARRAALRIRREPRVGRERGLLQHLRAERRPLALVLQPEDHDLAVAGGEGTIRIDGGVARAGARRRRRAFVRVVERVAHPFDERFQHRDVDVPAATRGRALQQRGEDVRIGVHAGRDVGDRRSRFRRRLLGAGDRQEARLALDQQVVGLAVAVRAVVAVAGNVADDDRRLVRRQRRVREPEPRCRAGGQVLHDDIGALAHQTLQDGLALRMLDVERQALLRPVGPDEMRRQAGHALVVRAGEVARARPLDLDDARAEVGQLPRAERRGDRVLERDDGGAGEWLHRRLLGHYRSERPHPQDLRRPREGGD